MTVDEIEAEGFRVDERLETLAASDSPAGIATSMGMGATAFGEAFARERPDVLLTLGDRFEMHAAALAALPFALPVAHVHGGESTEGAIDESLRHSLTKLSHLHFPSTEHHARRIVQMGEEPWRVTVSGAPGLDSIRAVAPLSREALDRRFDLDPARPFLLVTYHPVTLDHERTGELVDAFLRGLEGIDAQVVVTHPNADTARDTVLRALRAFVARRTDVRLVVNAGTAAYFGLMTYAEAMVGNSSSGIIEAASFRLPVVNVGMRQQGRLRGANVIDVSDDADAVRAGILRATSSSFRESLTDLTNLYGDGRAAGRIASRLAEVDLDQRLLVKRFHMTA